MMRRVMRHQTAVDGDRHIRFVQPSMRFLSSPSVFRSLLGTVLLFATITVTLAAETPRQQAVACRRLPLTETDVKQITLKNNFQVQWARFETLKTSYGVDQTRSVFDTVLGVGASYESDESDRITTIAGTQSTRHQQFLSIDKRWPSGTITRLKAVHERSFSDSPFNQIRSAHETIALVEVVQSLGRNLAGRLDRAAVKAASARAQTARWMNLDLVMQAVAQAQEAYWDYVYQLKRRTIVKDMHAQAKRLLENVKRRAAVGLMEEPDVLQAQALVEERALEMAAAENDAAASEALLKVSMGWPADASYAIEPMDVLTDVEPLALNAAEAMTIATQNRPDYLALKHELKEKHIELEMARDSRWPRIELSASLARNGVDPSSRDAFSEITGEHTDDWSVGISVSMPLENTTARAAFAQSRIEVTQALLRIKELEFQMAVLVENQLKRIRMREIMLRHAARTVALQRKKLKAEEGRFEQGRSSMIRLVEFHDDLLSARLNEARQALGLRLERVRLEAMLGRLVTADDIQPPQGNPSATSGRP